MVVSIVTIESLGRAQINRLSQSTADGIALLIENDLQNRIKSLADFAEFSQLKSNMTDDDWQSISKTLYDSQSGYRAIGWIDKAYNIRRVTPTDGNEAAQKFKLALNPPALHAAIEAQKQDKAILTQPLESIHGGAGFGIYVPAYNVTKSPTLLYSCSKTTILQAVLSKLTVACVCNCYLHTELIK